MDHIADVQWMISPVWVWKPGVVGISTVKESHCDSKMYMHPTCACTCDMDHVLHNFYSHLFMQNCMKPMSIYLGLKLLDVKLMGCYQADGSFLSITHCVALLTWTKGTVHVWVDSNSNWIYSHQRFMGSTWTICTCINEHNYQNPKHEHYAKVPGHKFLEVSLLPHWEFVTGM